MNPRFSSGVLLQKYPLTDDDKKFLDNLKRAREIPTGIPVDKTLYLGYILRQKECLIDQIVCLETKYATPNYFIDAEIQLHNLIEDYLQRTRLFAIKGMKKLEIECENLGNELFGHVTIENIAEKYKEILDHLAVFDEIYMVISKVMRSIQEMET